jgi:hypothetical protein
MSSPAASSPLQLKGSVHIIQDTLTIRANGTSLQLRLAAEAAEWIWQELAGDGNRREAVEVKPVVMTLTSKGLTLIIGSGPEKYPLFRTLKPFALGVLVDRQRAVNEGRAPGAWKEITL